MRFIVNNELLTQARKALFGRDRLYWIVGGAGSGKTTICREISDKFHIPLYDMDAHIYGAYHGRFTQERHPVNTGWSTAQDGLAWLLDMTWDQFEGFNKAALAEYLDLLVEDFDSTDPHASLLVDGGICNPAILAQVISPRQIVCLARPGRSSAEIWEETAERNTMKEMVCQLPNPEEAWHKFLEFDHRITQTILRECQDSNIAICSRHEKEPVDEFAEVVANTLGIQKNRK